MSDGQRTSEATRVPDGCMFELYSSRMCEVGTKGCPVTHAQRTGDAQTEVFKPRDFADEARAFYARRFEDATAEITNLMVEFANVANSVRRSEAAPTKGIEFLGREIEKLGEELSRAESDVRELNEENQALLGVFYRAWDWRDWRGTPRETAGITALTDAVDEALAIGRLKAREHIEQERRASAEASPLNTALAEERELCAKVAEDYAPGCMGGVPIAAAIRRLRTGEEHDPIVAWKRRESASKLTAREVIGMSDEAWSKHPENEASPNASVARDYYDELGDMIEKHPPGLGSGEPAAPTPSAAEDLADIRKMTDAEVDAELRAAGADPAEVGDMGRVAAYLGMVARFRWPGGQQQKELERILKEVRLDERRRAAGVVTVVRRCTCSTAIGRIGRPDDQQHRRVQGADCPIHAIGAFNAESARIGSSAFVDPGPRDHLQETVDKVLSADSSWPTPGGVYLNREDYDALLEVVEAGARVVRNATTHCGLDDLVRHPLVTELKKAIDAADATQFTRVDKGDK